MSSDVNLEEILEDEYELIDARSKRNALEQSINSVGNVWGHSVMALEAKQAAMTMLSTKTGMYAKIPIVCKGEDCPYTQNCVLLSHGLTPVGEYCPMETAEIELRYIGYANDFDIDQSSFTDKALMSDVIFCDIMMERAKALMAKEGVPIVEIIAGMTENGESYTNPAVSKYWEAYEKIKKKRDDSYGLLVATRKDKRAAKETNGPAYEDIIAQAINLDLDDEEVKPE